MQSQALRPYEVLLSNCRNILSSTGTVLHHAQLLGRIPCTSQPRTALKLFSSFSVLDGIILFVPPPPLSRSQIVF